MIAVRARLLRAIPVPARRLSFDQQWRRATDNVRGGVRTARDPLGDPLHGALGDRRLVRVDRRQGRDGVGAFFAAVEAHDGKVVRYPPAVLGGGTQRPDGQQVVEAEHGVGRLGQGQQRPHRLRAVAAVVLRCRRHQLGDDR
jgi:hypothetical protein